MQLSCILSCLVALLIIITSDALSRLSFIQNRNQYLVGAGLQSQGKILLQDAKNQNNYFSKLTARSCSQHRNENDNLNSSFLSSNTLFEDEDLTFESGILAQVMPFIFTASLSILFFGGMITFFRPMVINAADSIVTFSQPIFDPSAFQPVCPASDSFYQLMKSFIATIIGQENIAEYGPLVASVLLRVRLELCVFESFIYEAVIPFVRVKGLSWILPLHETLETFLAGTIFAVASNFILLGSTKIFSVLLIYIDAIFGFPARFIGSNLKKFSSANSVQKNVGLIVNVFGDVVGTTRRTMEIFDTFVGRYLVFSTTIYIAFKFLHFKFFNGIFP